MERQIKRRKLKNYFIMKNIQIKMAVTNLVYMLLIFVVFIFAVLSPFYTDVFQFDEICYRYFSAKLFLLLLERFSVAMVLVLFLAFMHQIIITHKFCGPLINFAKTFKRISQGDLTRKIHLRRYDLLQNEADQINEMMDGLSNLIAEIKNENDLLLSTLEEITNDEETHANPASTLTKVKAHAGLCQRHLAQFQLAGQLEEAQNR